MLVRVLQCTAPHRATSTTTTELARVTPSRPEVPCTGGSPRRALVHYPLLAQLRPHPSQLDHSRRRAKHKARKDSLLVKDGNHARAERVVGDLRDLEELGLCSFVRQSATIQEQVDRKAHCQSRRCCPGRAS